LIVNVRHQPEPNSGSDAEDQVVGSGRRGKPGWVRLQPTASRPPVPVREARFPFFFNANGTANLNNPNSGVETIFT